MGKTNPRELSERITHQLIEDIRNGKYQQKLRLPPENILAQEYNVSRSMMRECLTEMERTGMISRRKGIGTLINRRIVNVINRLDLISDLDPTLTSLGHTIKTTHHEVNVIKAVDDVATNLEIPEGASVLAAERAIAIDGKPCIFLTDYIPMRLLSRNSYTRDDISTSIFQFLEEDADIITNNFLTELRAVALPPREAEILEMDAGSPILFLCELGFDVMTQPVIYCREYMVDRILHQMIVRKKI